MAGRRISYRTATLERALPVGRRVAWDGVTAAARTRAAGVALEGVGAVVEHELSDEPPWRRIVRLDGPHSSALCQTSITIRDDGDACLVAWSCLVDPTDVDDEALDQLVASVTRDGTGQLDAVEAAVTASS